MTTRKIVGVIEGMNIVLSIIVIDDNTKEMAFLVDDEVDDNLVFRYRSSDGGKQIAFHVLQLLRRCSTVEDWIDMIWSEEWIPRWTMWSNM